jgi:hypothetical protein
MMRTMMKWSSNGIALAALAAVLTAGLPGCGVSVPSVTIPNYTSSWTETTTRGDNTTQNSGVYYFGATGLVAIKFLTPLQTSAITIPGLENPSITQTGDILVAGQSVALYTLSGTYQGQAVSIPMNFTLLDGTLTNTGGNVTFVYRYRLAVEGAPSTATLTVTYIGALGAGGSSVNFTQITTQRTVTADGTDTVMNPETTVKPITWTLTTGNPLQ